MDTDYNGNPDPRDIDTDAEVQELLDRGIGHDPSKRTPETDAEVERIWEEASELLDRNNVPGAPQGPEHQQVTLALALDMLPITEEFDKVSIVIQVEPIGEDGVVNVKGQTRGLNSTIQIAEMLEDMALALRQGTITQEQDSEEVARAKAAHPAGKLIAPTPGGFNPEPI
jgi:hypothetical protein